MLPAKVFIRQKWRNGKQTVIKNFLEKNHNMQNNMRSIKHLRNTVVPVILLWSATLCSSSIFSVCLHRSIFEMKACMHRTVTQPKWNSECWRRQASHHVLVCLCAGWPTFTWFQVVTALTDQTTCRLGWISAVWTYFHSDRAPFILMSQPCSFLVISLHFLHFAKQCHLNTYYRRTKRNRVCAFFNVRGPGRVSMKIVLP